VTVARLGTMRCEQCGRRLYPDVPGDRGDACEVCFVFTHPATMALLRTLREIQRDDGGAR
jgi:hypothetical protein